MRFIKSDINLNFIGKSRLAFYISATMILISFISLILHKGPKYGIDFAGGTLIQVKLFAPSNINVIKSGLDTVELGKSSVQQFGNKEDNEYLIKTNKSIMTSKGFSGKVKNALESATGNNVEIRRIEMVGPQVGKDLREKALFAMFYALLFITIYISGRFEFKWISSGIMATALMGSVYFLSFINVSIPILITAAFI